MQTFLSAHLPLLYLLFHCLVNQNKCQRLKKYNKKNKQLCLFYNERAGIRTPDNLIKSQVLSQLSYTPVFNYFITPGNEKAQSRNRTSDTRIFSPLLYQLSYLGIRLKKSKLRGQDLNLRPSGYEPDELPDCSTPRY